MKKIRVIVWWSAGKGDGDCNEEIIKVEDDIYNILLEIEPYGQELYSIKDDRVKDLCEKWEDDLIKEFIENSVRYADDKLYKEDCLIDPDSDDYDPNNKEEQFLKSKEKWIRDMYSIGVRFDYQF
ncbi:MAG: hypothetical protein IJJ00_04550 [Erysipelotrichaceae bacterium]|nr:hypothetical protein [Erysipelotrichaceae bacterium]